LREGGGGYEAMLLFLQIVGRGGGAEQATAALQFATATSRI